MANFKATNLSTNEVVEYSDELPNSEHLTNNWKLEEVITLPIIEREDVIQEPIERIWDTLDFLRRFTDTERKTVWAVRDTNADLNDAIILLMKSDRVFNTDSDVIKIVTMLESVGILATGRAQEILNGD